MTDPDGQETLNRVFIAENEDGSILTPTPNILTDSGTGLDEVAGDSYIPSHFLLTVQTHHKTEPYFMQDKTGLFSDTQNLLLISSTIMPKCLYVSVVM